MLEKRGEKLKSEGIGKCAGCRSGIVMRAQRCNAHNAHNAIWHYNANFFLLMEFFSVSMTESSCGEYMKRVRKIVSALKECGEKIKDEDVAYTILLGLGEKYSPLVVTLTNMAIPENPLSMARVSEQILTEEQRLNQFNSPQQKPDQNVNNPLAYK